MPVAVVTGGNRGLGLETARQLAAKGWTVVIGSRDLAAGEEAAAGLREATGAEVSAVKLDVTSDADVTAAAEAVRARYGTVDALVNNAGATVKGDREGGLGTRLDVLRQAFENNTLGAYRVTQAFAPLVVAARGTITNVSSGMGGITEMDGNNPGYRLSKASLNALTRIWHAELHARGVRVNSVCPGWVRTDMGGPRAMRDVPSGASGIVWAATLGPDGPSGGFFRDGAPIAF